MSKLGVKVLIYQDTNILEKLKEIKNYGVKASSGPYSKRIPLVW